MATEKRLIDAKKLPYSIAVDDNGKQVFYVKATDIDNAPTVDAVEVVHGRWVDSYGGKYANPRYVCSECKEKALYKFEDDELHIGLWVQELTDYCPNCGAKMDL